MTKTKVARAKEILEEIFSDTTVPVEATRDQLVDIRDEINELLAALPEKPDA